MRREVEAPAAVTAALATLVDPPRGRPARFWIGTSRGENGKSKVTFAWEPIPPVPGERRPGDESVSHVTLTALAPDGRPLFRGACTRAERRGAHRRRVRPAPGPVSASFDVPPGRMQLRDHGAERDGPGHGFVDERRRRCPTTRRRRCRSGRRACSVPGHRATSRRSKPIPPRRRRPTACSLAPSGCSSASTPTRRGPHRRRVTARLLNRAGTPMFDVPVQMSDTGAAEMELSFASLAAGEYLLELNAKADAGAAQEVVAFRVR